MDYRDLRIQQHIAGILNELRYIDIAQREEKIWLRHDIANTVRELREKRGLGSQQILRKLETELKRKRAVANQRAYEHRVEKAPFLEEVKRLESMLRSKRRSAR